MATALYKERVPHALVDGIFRVDIMRRQNGQWVVNELESLEATYTAPGDRNSTFLAKLTKYYFDKINDLL